MCEIATWSEFGRRPRENASAGTDHGTAAPLILVGDPVKGGFFGEASRLDQLDRQGNLRYAVDFRSSSWMKRHVEQRTWSWIHRTSYVAFALTFAHAVLSGTDFSAPAVSALAWSIGFAILVLSAARLAWGRLPS